jgi:outer membrane receptor for ferrienterochelin and colicins
MIKFVLMLIAFCCAIPAIAQNSLTAIIKDVQTKETLHGAIVLLKGTEFRTVSDSHGKIEFHNVPAGTFILLARYVGYKTKTENLEFPLTEGTREIFLEPDEEELEEILVSSTRSSRTIDDIPTRVEAISGEELEEKANMKPGEIRMVLNESTGIQTQQTSATSYNSSIRIQGLDGKYTQMIRDGFPLYSEFSSGLGLLQIAPLDLMQVEVIKGSSSTLYGGGAIAGLVNLISKIPREERELSFVLNLTSALGLDASGFYSQKFRKTGLTVFASYNHGTAFDPAKIGLTAIPDFNRYTLNPKIFFYPDPKTNISVSFNGIVEDRTGGDTEYIKGLRDSNHTYYEKNITNRYSAQINLERELNSKVTAKLKGSVSYYKRSIEIPGYVFSGKQVSTYSELNLDIESRGFEWIAGLNFLTDRFRQDVYDSAAPVNHEFYTLGAFVQNTWNAAKKLTFETGLRGDYQNEYGFFLLPRVSALYKANQKLTLRFSTGLGYKTPTVFTEDAEKLQFRNVLPIDISNTRVEKSLGGNIDLNYYTLLPGGKVNFSINQLIFYTKINNPLVLTGSPNGYYRFEQPQGYIDTKGTETNIKLSYKHFKLFIGYTYADAKQHYAATTDLFLLAKHRLNNVLIYEIENNLKAGLEAYYFSPQKLSDGTTGRAYWLTGFMVEKIWKGLSVFINFENFLDSRQTKFESIYTGTLINPVFRDIYAPVDGFVINGGIKIKL